MDRVYRALKARKMAADVTANVSGSSAWLDDGDKTAHYTAMNEMSGGGNTQRDSGSIEIEKHFLQAVERGDVQRAKRYLETAASPDERAFNINCVDPLGR
jgi:hypothetical protein